MASALFALANSLGNQFRLAEAVEAYRRGISVSRPHAAAHHNLGAVLAQLDRAEESLVELTRAEELGFSRAILHINRGRALTQLYRLDEAEQSFARAIELEPRNVDAQLMLAQLRFMRGDPDCVRDVMAAASAWKSDPSLQLLLAEVLRRLGDHARAEQVLRDALTPSSAPPRLRTVLASTLHEAGRLDEALIEAQLAAHATPDDATALEALVSAQLSLGRHDSARPIIQAQRTRQPHDQLWIAHETTAARLAGDPLYRELCDYERFVQVFDLEPPRDWPTIDAINHAVLAALNARHGFANHPLDQSLRHGSQTARSLLTDADPSIGALLEAFAAPLTRYCQSLGQLLGQSLGQSLDSSSGHPLTARNTGRATLSGCWSVQLRRDGFHMNHVHRQGWISSAYYVAVPAESTDLAARSGWLKFGEPRLPVPGAGAERVIQPQAGRLVLFPSYFWHGTNPIRGPDPRTTVAFDAVPAA